MINYCVDLKERLRNLKPDDENYIEKVVELLAWFQHRFVWIHPFQDYNGRVARMLTIFILLILKLPPVEIKAETGRDRKNTLKPYMLRTKEIIQDWSLLLVKRLTNHLENQLDKNPNIPLSLLASHYAKASRDKSERHGVF